MKRASFCVLTCLSLSVFAEEPESTPEQPLIDGALKRLRTDCKTPELKVLVRWEKLEKGYVDDENQPFNAAVVDFQGQQLLLAIADGCRTGLTVVDKVIVTKPDRISTRYERPTRAVPLERLRALDTLELTLNGNDASFRTWRAANFGKAAVDPYTQIFKGLYDAAVFKEDIETLQRNVFGGLPPQMVVKGKTLFIGLGSTVEINAMWFNRVLDLALVPLAPKK